MKLEDILQDVVVNKAKAKINPAKGYNIRGKIVFTQVNGGVKVFVDLTGAPPGKHGFHIHEYGVCKGDFESAGGHFDPFDSKHGAPNDGQRHVGDLGNLTADKKGRVNFSFVDEHLSFEGSASILYKSIVVHKESDDFKTQPTGGAGDRIACGVIKEA